ncbi:MAG: alpha/beta fold hydrolase, partial [Ottowia sp.]|nr:alpha/beta fold hydrolase [Ottowia sp.]
MASASPPPAVGQPGLGPLRRVHAGVLDVVFHESGPPAGTPVLLMHGFPYDVQAYAEVAPLLAARGLRVIVPFLRGYGGTRFVDAATPRSGEQAALGADLLALLDALRIDKALLAGYDWGGRAACIVAALWPERCLGLVSQNSYN